MKLDVANMLYMRAWFRERRIAFEFTNYPEEKCIEIKFIDYKNKCLLVSAKYPAEGLTPPKLQILVREFEEKMIFPMVFDDIKFHDREPPDIRLIRED